MKLKIGIIALNLGVFFLLNSCYTTSKAVVDTTENKRSTNNNHDSQQAEEIRSSESIENKINKVSKIRKTLVVPE